MQKTTIPLSKFMKESSHTAVERRSHLLCSTSGSANGRGVGGADQRECQSQGISRELLAETAARLEGESRSLVNEARQKDHEAIKRLRHKYEVLLHD
eukprot:109766-Amphidinium_carterae.1